jgi:hypothetical protein
MVDLEVAGDPTRPSSWLESVARAMRHDIAVTCKQFSRQNGSEENPPDKRSINGAGMFGEGLVAGVTIYGGPATSNVQASTRGGVRKGW